MNEDTLIYRQGQARSIGLKVALAIQDANGDAEKLTELAEILADSARHVCEKAQSANVSPERSNDDE